MLIKKHKKMNTKVSKFPPSNLCDNFKIIRYADSWIGF